MHFQVNKHDRLKRLPPAARVASVRVYDKRGELSVVTRYVEKPRDLTSRSVNPGEELWGVPYEIWRQHVGCRRPIRLWEWHGTDEGMIGGPAKRQVLDCVFFGKVWEFPEKLTHDERLHHADDLECWLRDERYEFSERTGATVAWKIVSLWNFKPRMPVQLTHVEEWLEEMRQGKAEA